VLSRPDVSGGGAKAVGNAVNERWCTRSWRFRLNVVVTPSASACRPSSSSTRGGVGTRCGTSSRLSAPDAAIDKPIGALSRVGDHTLFYAKSLAGIPFAVRHYRREIIRLIAEISMGAGTLAMIGGDTGDRRVLDARRGGTWPSRL